LFWFFESGGQLGRVPNEFGIPFGDHIRKWWNNRKRANKKQLNNCTDEDENGNVDKVKFQIGSSSSDSLVRNGPNKSSAHKKPPNGHVNGEPKGKKKPKIN